MTDQDQCTDAAIRAQLVQATIRGDLRRQAELRSILDDRRQTEEVPR